MGASNPQTIEKLAEIISKRISIPKRPGEPECTWANINKIKRHLNWKPTVNFETGVKEMLKNIGH